MRPPRTLSRTAPDSRIVGAFRAVVLAGGTWVLLFCPLTSAVADQEYMTVRFDDKTVDQQIGTAGPESGEPSWVDEGLGAIVRSAPFSTPCLEFSNVTSNGSMGFDLTTPITEGVAAFITDLWFYEDSDWEYVLYLRNSSNQQIATLWFRAVGHVDITALGFDGIEDIPYATGRPLPILFVIDFDGRTWSVWIDGVQWVNNQPLHEQITDFRRVMVGAGWGSSDENRVSIDQIRIIDRLPPVPVEPVSWGMVKGLYR